MDEQKKEDGGIDPTQQYEDEDDDDFDPFLHATVPRNLYHKFQTEGSKRWGPPTEILPFLGSCFCANEEELLRELGVDHILNVAEECPPPPTVARKEGEKLVKHYMMVDVVEHIRKSENQWNTFEACFNFIDKARVAYEGKNGGGKKRKGSKRMKRPGKDGEEKSGERKGSGMKIRLSLRAGKEKEKEKEKENGCSEAAGPSSDRVLVHCMHGRSRSATIVLAYLMKKEGWTLREAYVHVKLRRPIVGPDKYLKHQLIDYEKHLFGKSSFQSVEEFRDFQVQLSPELELKEKERKQKMKEEALQQEQSSSNDDNATKGEASAGADADEADVEGGADCNKEMMADGEDELDGTTNNNNNHNHSSSNDKEEGEGKGSGKKKKSKKSKKASGGEESTSDAGEKEEKKKKRKKKCKKRKDGSTTSSSSGNNSTTASPRLREGEAEQEEEDECNNRTRGGSVAAPKDEPGPATKAKKKKKADQPPTLG